MLKKWRMKPYSGEKTARLAAELGISQLLAGALINRGIETREKGEIFLHPERFEYCDPFLLPDMDKAVKRIVKAIDNKERISIYGDYDCDGITATSLLMITFKDLGVDVDYYIPDRLTEGYGLHTEAMEKLAAKGINLLITVDCGIKSVEEIKAVAGRMDVIVTDHHLPGEELPEAVAVVDAHRRDSQYPCPELAGVGIAFKLCQALWQEIKGEPLNDRGIELVALGTVADAVPLVNENRRIVSVGQKAIESSRLPGMRALLESVNPSGKPVNSGLVGYWLAPRINAAGRLSDASLGVELLTCTDETRAAELAETLNGINNERKQLKDDMQLEAEEQLKSVDIDNAKVLVVAGEDWHHGVIGLMATGLVNKYYKPAIAISLKDGIGKGSARSIDGFNLYEALENCKDVLVQFGGHEAAAGLTIKEEDIPEFRRRMEKEAMRQLTAEQFIPFYELEQEISPLEITMEMVEELALLEPCGTKNESPLFGYRGARGAYASYVGDLNQHIRFSITDGNRYARAIAFHMNEDLDVINSQPLDLVYTFNINEYMGTRYLQCVVQSMDHPLEDERPISVDREFLKDLYLFLKQCRDDKKPVLEDAPWLAMRMRRDGRQSEAQAVEQGLKIFQELGLLEVDADGVCHLVEGTGKMNLQDSPTFCRLNG
ncbi:Single-stranded-DNA-specific exonuclease RecJ [Anaerovibrio sp. JC8]|uniref:single-stranded-DNA-specific exonuclease RecJ n=1 Tax=Anaerovibrio sp. JC8 TaxID=1240085 RepID=UPI000A09CA9C|nr:single-stranded-DNA-specific exonuclease RecJ [Anaerovibrio sp. JC8]ORU00276.1 Single-stranded-DNA-specific exonuclease RecJ [Anaerovibrio sp. JC8]